MLNPYFAFKDPQTILNEMYVDNPIDVNPIEMYVLQYKTDPEAIRANVHPAFATDGEEPRVTVVFLYIKEGGLVRGGDIGISCIMSPARWEGEQEKVDGEYVYVMPEDNNYNVMTGRDMYGANKIVDDLPYRYIMNNGAIRCEVQQSNHVVYGIEVNGLKKCDEETAKNVQDVLNARPFLQYKLIVNPWGGPPDVAYPVCCPPDFRVDELWMGTEGSFYIGDLPAEMIVERHVARALKEMPVKEVYNVMKINGNLLFKRNDFRKLL